MIAASGPLGVRGFMNAAFGLRATFFFATFFAGAFFGAAFFAAFFATFLAGAFLAGAFFAAFFAAFFVAIDFSPREFGCHSDSVLE
jgi:ABC-type Na+ efflux pump permease subunit